MQRRTVMYIRSQTSMDRTRFLLSVTVQLAYVTHSRTSQLFNTPNMSRSAYRASVNPQDCVAWDVVWKSVLQVQQNLDRSSAQKTVERSNTRNTNFRTTPNGDRKNGIRTIEIISVSTAMIQVQHHVRQHVRHTFRFRDM